MLFKASTFFSSTWILILLDAADVDTDADACVGADADADVDEDWVVVEMLLELAALLLLRWFVDVKYVATLCTFRIWPDVLSLASFSALDNLPESLLEPPALWVLQFLLPLGRPVRAITFFVILFKMWDKT